jgi:molybdopterin/thiamine biosynthesis adenylyltransferase
MKTVGVFYIIGLFVFVLSIFIRYLLARKNEWDDENHRLSFQSRVKPVNTSVEDFSRINSLINIESLRKQSIALFGAGSLGSWVAYYVGNLIGEIKVIDSDAIDVSNITGGRTIYSKVHLGVSKSQGLKQILENDFPHLRVLAYTDDINKLSDTFLEDILESDLIVCAVDDVISILRINRLFYGRKPIIYGGFMRQAAEGFISVITANTPCFQCCLKLQAENFNTLHREPGLGLDISMVANYLAKLVIAMLDESQGTYSRPIRNAIQEGKNLLHISNRTGVFSREPFSVLWLSPEKQTCNICNPLKGGD